MQARNSGVPVDIVVISLVIDGKKIEQPIHRKFLNTDGTANNNVLAVVSRIHKDISGIQDILTEKDPKNFSNQCFATDISAMMEVRRRMEERLPRLHELLDFIKDGTFSFGCTLTKCKYHSENEGGCACGEDLTELMKIVPDLCGCATGRRLLQMDRRRYYDEILPLRRGHARKRPRKRY